jgi:UDP-sulfoquinovose synthase
MRNVLVLGADGYLGWPTALHLAGNGDRVVAVDNLVRRRWDVECGTESLLPLLPMPERIAAWESAGAGNITWRELDLCDAAAVDALIEETLPDAVVHFAEQRSAPFSMIDREHAVLTQVNNVVGTLNLIFALHRHAPRCHLVKLGTMGEYGTPNIDIEEGYLTVEHNGRIDTLPFPMQPGSFYHLSKVHDSHNLRFACRIWGLAATDLNQGVVYGWETEETALHPSLGTRFDYDSIWGTVLNRFCAQAAVGDPLTVYGEGGQTRGFLDIRDTVACVRLAIDHPAQPGEFRVFNQFTEQFTVLQLAEMVREARASHGLETVIQHLPNPRVEREAHYYNAKHQHLLDLGLHPHVLQQTLIDSVIGMVQRRAEHVNRAVLGRPTVDWRDGDPGREAAQARAPGRTLSGQPQARVVSSLR